MFWQNNWHLISERKIRMKKRLAIFIAVLTLLLTVTLSGCAGSPAATSTPAAAPKPTSTPAPVVELTVSAAASLTEAMTEIGEKYKEIAPDVKITFNFASSGTLQTQIEQGAAADVFVSAAQKQMNALETKGLIDTPSRIDLLVNKVVLIVPKDSGSVITSFDDCLTDKASMIAIGDPESVPVGQYAKEVFTFLGGWDAVSAKANLGSDVKQVLSWVETGDADCGVVYSTDAATSGKVDVVSEAPEGSHAPVIYPAAIVSASTYITEARAFLDYLKSEEAGNIFTSCGFTVSD